MIAYLADHFRYDTMNSWNASTSYAANVKIRKLTFPSNEVRNRAYDLLQTDEAFEDVRDIMHQFDEDHNYEWQVGFNGRSSGYIVLYHGGIKDTGHKSRCTSCGQLNFTKIEENSNKCGRCNQPTRVNLTAPRMQSFTLPGKSVDMGEYFEEWDTYSLKQRVKLVMEFDRMVEQCIKAFVDFCTNHEAAEETYSVQKKRLVAKKIT